MKKIIRFFIYLIIIAGILFGLYRYFLSGKSSYRSIYLVPENATLIVESDAVFDAWSKIIHSNAWKTVSHIEALAELNHEIQYLDSLLSKKMFLLRVLGRRKVMMSIHEYSPGKYDYLYIVNVGKLSRLRNPEKILSSLLGKEYPVTKRMYNGQTVYELFDQKSGEMYTFSFVHEKLVFSTNYLLTEASLDEQDKMTLGRDLLFCDVMKRVSGRGLFNVYLSYQYFPSYLESVMGKTPVSISKLKDELTYSAFSFSINTEGLIELEGYTGVNDSVSSFYSSALETGTGGMKSLEVIPSRIASMVKISIENAPEYFKNSLDKLDPGEYKDYMETLGKLEKKFKISVNDNILNWIGDEIVLLQTQPSNLGQSNEFAAVIKAKNKKLPKENLDYLCRQIKRNSPIKIKTVPYGDYTISYISFPGLIKLLFGRMLDKIEKPYYTQINEYVIFSNHPQTLKNIIDDYVSGNTLANSERFNDFARQFSRRSSAYTYIDIPVIYNNLKSFVGEQTWQKLDKNKPYITHFPQAGIEIDNKDNLLHLSIKTKYNEVSDEFSRMHYDADSFLKLFSFNEPESPKEPLWYEPEIIINDLDMKKISVDYEEGGIHYEAELKNGLKHGVFKEYYPDGSLKVRGKFKDDFPEGTWKLYDEKGDLIEEKTFD